jgi:hypothetical protein
MKNKRVLKKKKPKTIIVKRTSPDGNISWVIQQRHFLFWWWWVDAWVNSSSGASCQDSFFSEKEAKENLCYFDGSQSKNEIIFKKF